MALARQAISGVLLLDKPTGLTSRAALARAQRALNAAKAGHTGTLDPLASGLLPLCFGEATKFAGDLLDADKGYRATLHLGVTTTTGDAEGEVLERRPVRVDFAQLEAARTQLTGPILQVPPMFSALKHEGKPLYRYARAGQEIERSARPVTVHRLVFLRIALPEVEFEVLCSKGTYVRTLAEDLGAQLGCGAHLTALRRTQVGRLELKDAIELETFERLDAAERSRRLLPVDALVQDLPAAPLGPEEARRFVLGQRLAGTPGPVGRVRVYGPGDPVPRFLGVGALRADGVLAPERLVAQDSDDAGPASGAEATLRAN